MRVRDATPGDRDIIVDFNERLAIESGEEALDRAVLVRGVTRALERRDMCRYFLAEHEGQVVGQTMITTELTDWQDGMIWWLQSVYVAPEHRGQGVFRMLFEHIRGTARADGDARCLRLYALETNARALEVYRRVGMTPRGYVVYEAPLLEP
jgi:GNAT superfamily N-acetyltransferase